MAKEKVKSTPMKVLTIIGCVLFCLVWLGCCAFFLNEMHDFRKMTNPEKEEYVGTWACYLSKASTNSGTQLAKRETLDEAEVFIQLFANGDAKQIVALHDETASVWDGYWKRTTQSQKEGTYAGFVIVGKTESFENLYRYFIRSTEPETHFVDTPLIEGNLAIDYGYRVDYFEKISNDPNYQLWLSRTETSNDAEDSTRSSTSPGSGTRNQDWISWADAKDHIGETVTIYGTVASTEYASTSNGKPTFLDLGAAYPDPSRVSIVIWGENRSAFSSSPEKTYDGKTVCITGTPYMYNGVCSIEVSSPSQIQVI